MSRQKAPPAQPELLFTPAVAPPERLYQLSKSRFVAGKQCHKLLWWRVHDRDAPELQPDIVLQDLFDQGVEVGKRARDEFPGGTLIDFPYDAFAEKVAATRV